MVQRPRPDLRGGCAAMRIPTATGSRGWVTARGHPATRRQQGRPTSLVRCLRHPHLPDFPNCRYKARRAFSARACRLSGPGAASQRYTVAADTPSSPANRATQRPLRRRSRATHLPVGRMARGEAAACVRGATPGAAFLARAAPDAALRGRPADAVETGRSRALAAGGAWRSGADTAGRPVELDLGPGQVAVAGRLRLLRQVADDLRGRSSGGAGCRDRPAGAGARRGSPPAPAGS